MSIVDVKESWSGSPASWSSPDGRDGEIVTTRKFTVTTDNSGDADISLDVLAATGIPVKGEPHPHNPFLKCRGCKANPVSPIFYEVTAEYKAETPDANQSPLDKPAVIKWSTVTEQGDIDEDINGKPITTVNGEPFKGIKKPFSDLKATIQKNFVTFDSPVFYAYRDTVNSNQFLGFPVGSAKIMRISADQIYDEDFPYFSITVEVQFRKPIRTTDARAWWKRIRHEGLYERTGGPTVSFSGGGGSGASALSIVESGAVTSISVAEGGTDYTTAPTVSFSGGGGSGATATASISDGSVSSVSVGAGGSGYDDSKVIHAVDDNGAEVKKPIMLKLDGTRETDPEVAHWIERPVFESINFDNLNLF